MYQRPGVILPPINKYPPPLFQVETLDIRLNQKEEKYQT